MSKRACGIVAHEIPIDLVVDILVWLPAKSVLRFKCVCKEWYNLINNNPLFLKLHLNKSLEPNSQHNNCILYWTTSILCVVDNLYDDHPPVKVTKLNWPITIEDDDCIRQVGSCNGLVCFNVTAMPSNRIRSFLICNLTTRTFKSIFPPLEKIREHWLADDSVLYSFSYDTQHDDYKIVVTKRLWTEDDRDGHIFIYSLKTNLWTSCYSPLTRISTEGRWSNIHQAIFEHNMLHFHVSFERTKGFTEGYRIARFDVADEKWTDDLSLPNQVLKSIVRLGNLDGRLLYVHSLNNDDSAIIWVMDEDGSMKKMVQLPKHLHSHHLLACSKEGRQRLLLQDCDGNGDVLKWYDRQNNKRIPLILKPPPKDRSAVMLCTASLIQIPGCSLKKLQEMKE